MLRHWYQWQSGGEKNRKYQTTRNQDRYKIPYEWLLHIRQKLFRLFSAKVGYQGYKLQVFVNFWEWDINKYTVFYYHIIDQAGSNINKNWLILENKSIVDIVCNSQLINNFKSYNR